MRHRLVRVRAPPDNPGRVVDFESAAGRVKSTETKANRGTMPRHVDRIREWLLTELDLQARTPPRQNQSLKKALRQGFYRKRLRMNQTIGLSTVVVALLFGAGSGIARSDTWAVHGDIVSVSGARPGWVVFDQSSIRDVIYDQKGPGLPGNKPRHPDAVPADAHLIPEKDNGYYPGYIFPGLIDCHNHAQWNVIPVWRPGRTFNNRYQWQEEPAYAKFVHDVYYDDIHGQRLELAALEYAEVRALIGGTTTLQSPYPVPVPPILVRNLDSTYQADSEVGAVTKLQPDQLFRFRTGFGSGSTRRVFLHIAEGRRDDARTQQEFPFLESIGLARPGVVVIHGVALTPPQFQTMKANGMYFVWSPSSNLTLYGQTADIMAAIAAGVTVALAPDWTITGSNNVLEEMKVADEYSKQRLNGAVSRQQIYAMATANAARVAGLSDRLGVIVAGNSADLILAPKLADDPFDSLLSTFPRHIQMVFIAGRPVYGDAEMLKQYVAPAGVDEIPLPGDGTTKAVYLTNSPSGEYDGGLRFNYVVTILKQSLPKLAPLVEDTWPIDLRRPQVDGIPAR